MGPSNRDPEFPTRYTPDRIPPGIADAVPRLMSALLDGPHPFLRVLREQYERALITSVELTGCGFFVDFSVTPDAPLTDPLDYSGGNAVLTINSAPNGGGCVVFVKEGHLSMLEVYTFGDEGWDEGSTITGIHDVDPPHP
jgi:hypothetical protein